MKESRSSSRQMQMAHEELRVRAPSLHEEQLFSARRQ